MPSVWPNSSGGLGGEVERDVRDGVRVGRTVDVEAGLCVRPSRELEHLNKPSNNSLGNLHRNQSASAAVV